MTVRRFAWIADIGGDDRQLHEASDTDEILGHVKDSDFPVGSGHKMLSTDAAGLKSSVTVNQDGIVGRDGTNPIRSLTKVQVRGLLNVEDGSEQNAAENSGEVPSLGIHGVFRDKLGSSLRMRSVGPSSQKRLKTTLQSDTRVLFDPLVTPYNYHVLGDARTDPTPTPLLMFRSDQAITLNQVNAVLTSTSPNNPAFQFTILRNSTRALAGATVVVDRSLFADRMNSQDGTGTGTDHKDDVGSAINTLSGENQIAVDDWVMLNIIAKTDDVAGTPTVPELSFSLYFEPT